MPDWFTPRLLLSLVVAGSLLGVVLGIYEERTSETAQAKVTHTLTGTVELRNAADFGTTGDRCFSVRDWGSAQDPDALVLKDAAGTIVGLDWLGDGIIEQRTVGPACVVAWEIPGVPPSPFYELRAGDVFLGYYPAYNLDGFSRPLIVRVD